MGKNSLHVSARKCSLCGVLEDEFHCPIVCPRFSNEREWFINKAFSTEPNYFDFINLFNHRKDNAHFNLALLCYKILKGIQTIHLMFRKYFFSRFNFRFGLG